MPTLGEGKIWRVGPPAAGPQASAAFEVTTRFGDPEDSVAGLDQEPQ